VFSTICLCLQHSHSPLLSTDEFLVIGPRDPIVAVLGEETILPCFLSQAENAENMELRWLCSRFLEAVFIYQNQQKEEEMPQYARWASPVSVFLTRGEAAVHIDKVQVSDDGLYTCSFKKGDYYEEATLEVKVAVVGCGPQVLMEGQEEDGVHVACRASGWFPKPQVQWRDRSEKLLTSSEAHAQDADGLFRLEASVVVRDSSVGNVTCSILNPILGQEKVKAIFIPESFFPQASSWKPAFAVSLMVLVVLIFGAGYFLKKEYLTQVQALKARGCLSDQREKVYKAALNTGRIGLLEAVETQNSSVIVCFLSARRKAQLNVVWQKKQLKAWSVTLDPRSACSNLVISQEKTSLTLKDGCVYGNNNTCSVLGREGITSGRCYREVEVGNEERGIWALGICREDANRSYGIIKSPENGFWVMERWMDKFYACTTTRLSPQSGGFLDYDNGYVSFYNLTDGSHIFSYLSISFTGTLFPYFMLMSGNMSLTICS
uniref:Butyrophilin subfamily 1 member A1 n=1 Tax=Loxodonta africana TaxID=9785 RepID=G3UHG1_LOXAF